MDAIDHCQTTREILRNEARHRKIDMNRLIIPEDGDGTIMNEGLKIISIISNNISRH